MHGTIHALEFAGLIIAAIPAFIGIWIGLDLAGSYPHRLYAVLRRLDRYGVTRPYPPGVAGAPDAYRQYFFGPATSDFAQVVRLAWRRTRDRLDIYTGDAREAMDWGTVPSFAQGLAMWGGVACGSAMAAALAPVFLVLHGAVVGCAQAVAWTGVAALRGADALARRARGVRVMRCPWCYEKNLYPVYHCPGLDGPCGRPHADIRPGRYGVVRRRCVCGYKLPTLILLGSFRLPAYCRHPLCGQPMSDETGRYREIVLPLIGGASAGKTRLMAAMMVAMAEYDRMRLANDETRDAFEDLATILDTDGYTLNTRPDLPHAHSVLLTANNRTNLLHMFDVSGELLRSQEQTDRLRYLPHARTFIFVLDLMAVSRFRTRLTPAEDGSLNWQIASPDAPERIFTEVFDKLTVMAPLKRCRLAVAISKTDLLRHTTPYTRRTDGGQGVRDWLTDELGLGNLVRLMDQNFAEVKFFFTSAITSAPRQADASIAPLISWVLRIPQPIRPPEPDAGIAALHR
jgi:hypothetical protein